MLRIEKVSGESTRQESELYREYCLITDKIWDKLITQKKPKVAPTAEQKINEFHKLNAEYKAAMAEYVEKATLLAA